MEIQLMCIGKTDRSIWSEAMDKYQYRLKHYIKFSVIYLPNIKIKKKIDPIKVKLLDESGKSFSSNAFSKEIENYMINGNNKIIFLIGGPYGFSNEIYNKFPKSIALSKMTFSHQMVRLFFCEQLYRALTIINKHPYHNN